MFRRCPLLLKEERALEVSCPPKFEMLPTSLDFSDFSNRKQGSQPCLFVNTGWVYGSYTTDVGLQALLLLASELPLSTHLLTLNRLKAELVVDLQFVIPMT